MITTRTVEDTDWDWVLAESQPIGGPQVIAGGFLHRLKDYPAILAEMDGEKVGFAVYSPRSVRWEILGILSTIGRQGIGSVLLDEVEARAKEAGAAQVRLSTTNDNFPAMRFCQLRGYRMRQLIPNAIADNKKLKGIPDDEPIMGLYGIEVRDEIILNKDV